MQSKQQHKCTAVDTPLYLVGGDLGQFLDPADQSQRGVLALVGWLDGERELHCSQVGHPHVLQDRNGVLVVLGLLHAVMIVVRTAIVGWSAGCCKMLLEGETQNQWSCIQICIF